ncbi:MAG: PilZ domain-containing protein [Lachnospiraceae bacterium]|nr:PilZ domain-containing protein [Lachnospiraceae bacterium]
MLIKDAMRGSSVLVEIEIQGQPVLISTQVIFGTSEGLLVNRIFIGDGDLIWRRPSTVTIQNKRDGKTYIFDAASIEPFETQYGFVHRIISNAEGLQKEMREAERMEVIRLGSVFSHGITYKAIVYDISATGIAVILDGNVHIKIGDNCSIRFTMGDSAEVLHAYEIDANVVRFFEVKGRVAMGCTVKYMPPGLLESLNHKESEKMLKAAMEADSDDVELNIDLNMDPNSIRIP